MPKKLWILFREMFTISTFVLGGGFAILAVVDERFSKKYGWTKEGEVIGTLPVLQMVPGMICTNCAIYVGNKVAGVAGAAAALLGTVLPGLFIFSAVTFLYDRIPVDHPVLAAAFSGLRAALAGIIAALVVRNWTKAIRGFYGYFAVVVATALITVGRVGVPWVILGAALAGMALAGVGRSGDGDSRRFRSAFWAIPLVFLKYGALAFGGGYVLVPLYIDDFVGAAAPYLQLAPEEFANVMALTQMTPGSISVNCATFFGLRLGGALGAVTATLAMCVPCFVLLLVLLRSLERFRANRWVMGLLDGIRPVTVAMMLSALWSFLAMSVWTAGEGGVVFHPLAAVVAVATFLLLHFRVLSVVKLIFLAAGLSALCGLW